MSPRTETRSKTAGRLVAAQKAREKAKRRGSPGAGARVPLGWIIAGVIGVAAVAAIILAGVRSEGPKPHYHLGFTGTTLPEYTGLAPDPAAGMIVPELHGQDFDGEAMSIVNDGRPKMILFLAHWCSHCQAEVPVVRDWIEREGMPEGIDVVSVSTAVDQTRGNYPPEDWLERERWNVPVLADDEHSSGGMAFGTGSYPYFVFVDANGALVARRAGELPIATIEALIEQTKAAAA